MIIAAFVMAYGGSKTWPWWSPLAAFAVLIPLTLVKLAAVGNWRRQAGLSGYSLDDVIVSGLINLAVLFAVFYLARGISVFIRRRRQYASARAGVASPGAHQNPLS